MNDQPSDPAMTLGDLRAALKKVDHLPDTAPIHVEAPMLIEIARHDEKDEHPWLHRQLWEFALYPQDASFVLKLTCYDEQVRETTRHKWKPARGIRSLWQINNRRDNRIEADAVPLPADVVAEAKMKIVSVVVDLVVMTQ